MTTSSSQSLSSTPPFDKSEAELREKTTSSVKSQLPHELNSVLRDEEWGTRVLRDEEEVFTLNAWDHAPPPKDLDEQVEKVKKIQREKPVSEQMKQIYNQSPASFWERFYDTHRESFFKDRKWLRLEFPELMEMTKADAGPRTIIEIGCGAGNALYPIYQANDNPELSIHGFDYSKSAVDVVKENPLYSSPHVGKVNAAVWDLSSPSIPDCIEPGTVDIAVMVFVLSALRPGEEWERAMGNVWRMLKPGGMVLLRDYGRHDLAQMRIKGNRMLDEDFYIRGDGTRVFFFDSDDLARIFTGKPAPFPVEVHTTSSPATKDETEGTSTPATPGEAEVVEDASTSASATAPSASTATSTSTFPSPWHPPHPLFSLEQLGVDRRLLVNRKKQLKMYRVWMQVKVKKILDGGFEAAAGEEEKKE
ncbi:S-adenosyl-L-methionine-dependent methyltransferase [Mrakia frigida]|uniref:tRNA(Thr) (cytosine(32)-N(3))-methyltransferase n=1 Tax=Mrakia frigida TaxID=29902 RepID=UPI003FCBF50B